MIPYLDLRAQYYSIKSEIDTAISGVLESSQFVLGREVRAFEEEFAAYCNTRFAVGVNSGTSALHLALLAAGIGPSDEVITVPFTFIATVASIEYTGARPVFADIDPRSFTIDVNQIENLISPRTKAILPVHLYGCPADMDAIMDIAHRHGLLVIEDAAQAHGAEYKGRRVGGIGDLGCFSFYPGKNLGAYGEGGAVTTNNPDYARAIRMMRNWGQEHSYKQVLPGYNYRMDGIQGAILRVKLRHLDIWTKSRRAKALRYEEILAGSVVQTPSEIPNYCRPVYHIYAVRVTRRDNIRKAMQANGIQTGIHYPIPVHLQPNYKYLGYDTGDFPCSEQIALEELSLPIYPELEDTAQVHIAESIRMI